MVTKKIMTWAMKNSKKIGVLAGTAVGFAVVNLLTAKPDEPAEDVMVECDYPVDDEVTVEATETVEVTEEA